MPNNGINRAKQKRAGSLGQSSRLYNFKTCNGHKVLLQEMLA